MKNKKQIVDTSNIDYIQHAAKLAGKEILSFQCDEISLVPGGGLEMGPIYNVVYKEDNKP